MKRTALVTGAAEGIGLEVCRELARRGLRVILTARTLEKAEAAARTLEGDVRPAALDVTDPQAARRIDEPVDVLVNNAALYPPHRDKGGVLDVPDEEWRALIETNFLGA